MKDIITDWCKTCGVGLGVVSGRFRIEDRIICRECWYAEQRAAEEEQAQKGKEEVMDWIVWKLLYRCRTCGCCDSIVVVSILAGDAIGLGDTLAREKDGHGCSDHKMSLAELIQQQTVHGIVERIPPVKCTVAGVPLEPEMPG